MQHTFSFLTQLRNNNNRDWLQANQPSFRAAEAEFRELVSGLIQDLSQVEPALGGLEVKDCTFRIYRDVRFSNDKTPYKAHFSAYFAAGGKKSNQAGYYFHLKPGGETLAAGGLYQPSAEDLKKVRQEIDYNAAEFRAIVEGSDFRRYFGELGGSKLKRPPKHYPADHPEIEYIKHKDFIVQHLFADETVLKPLFRQELTKAWQALQPLVRFLNRALE